MKWLGPLLRKLYDSPPCPEVERELHAQREIAAAARSTRLRVEALAGDPMGYTLHRLLEDLR